MRDKSPPAPRSKTRLHRVPRMALREDPIEHPLNALPIGEVPQRFSDHKTFVAGSGSGQCVQQTVAFVVEHNLHFLRQLPAPTFMIYHDSTTL